MVSYRLKIDKDALLDIQQATDRYNKLVNGLGTRFQKQTKSQINSLKKNPHIYTKRYTDVRCMPVQKFPYMVHYTVDSNCGMVEIFAVINTAKNPDTNWLK